MSKSRIGRGEKGLLVVLGVLVVLIVMFVIGLTVRVVDMRSDETGDDGTQEEVLIESGDGLELEVVESEEAADGGEFVPGVETEVEGRG